MKKRFITTLLSFFLLSGLSACGQVGPLSLPKNYLSQSLPQI